MDEEHYQEQIATTLKAIQALLERSVEVQSRGTQIHSSILELEEGHAETAADMLESTRVTNTLAGQRTDMAKERTGLVREQTRLSTKSTELSVIRTDMSRERSGLAGQRTNLSVLRTDLSRSRTSLADQRNKMAENRTKFSSKRTAMASFRSNLSNMRTSLAQGRTHLALIRTGLAFFSIAIAFFRMFGLSWWSLFDAVLAAGSVAITVIGILGYRRDSREVRRLKTHPPDSGETAA